MRILSTFLATLVALVAVLFAVSNRTPVVVEIWPLPYRLETGLYAVILLAAGVGFVAGLGAAWIAGGKRRRAMRALRREARDLQASLARAQMQAQTRAELPPPGDVPLR